MRRLPAFAAAAYAWLACAALAGAEPAPDTWGQAEPAAARLAFVWNAPDGCPSRERVLARAEQLLGRSPEAELPQPLAIDATVTRVGEQAWELVLRAGAADAEPRRVSAAFCAELGEMAALFTALSVDPTLPVESTATFADMSTSVKKDASAPVHRGEVASSGAAPSEVVVSAPTRARAPGEARARALQQPAAAPARPRVRPLVGASVALGFGRLPGPSLGVAVEGGVAIRRLSLRAGIAYFPERHASTATDAGGDLALGTAGARIMYALAHGVLSFAPAAGVTLGWMHGEGTGVDSPDSGDALLVTLEPGVRGAYALSSSWALVADAALTLAVNRPGFVAEGIGEIYRPSRVGARFGLGAEWCLP